MLSATWPSLKCFTNNQISLCANKNNINYSENKITRKVKECNEWPYPFTKYCAP